jgi:tetratricopeptide (TPR) repeat protein
MAKIPHTKQFPWHIGALIGGSLLSFLVWMTLYLNPPGQQRTVTYALVAGGLLLVLSGLVGAFDRYRKAQRGLVPSGGIRRTRATLTLSMLLVLIFALSLWPLPYPYATVGNVLALISLSLAIWVAWRLVQNRAPLDYGRARRAYSQGDDETALSLLSAEPTEASIALGNAVQIAPFLPEGYLNLGMARVEAKEDERAIDALSRALRLGFRDDVAELMTRFYLLHALERLGDHTRAEIERRRLRHRRGTLKRWRAELEGDIRQATSQSKERALLSAIERAIEKSI